MGILILSYKDSNRVFITFDFYDIQTNLFIIMTTEVIALRINSAADDIAGLSMLQVADGGLDIIGDMLKCSNIIRCYIQ